MKCYVEYTHTSISNCWFTISITLGEIIIINYSFSCGQKTIAQMLDNTLYHTVYYLLILEDYFFSWTIKMFKCSACVKLGNNDNVFVQQTLLFSHPS